MRRKIAVTLAVIATIVLFAPCRSLQAAPPFYEEKRITIIVSYGPGGGFDSMARLLSKYLPRHIPGKPAINVLKHTVKLRGNLVRAVYS